MLTLSIFQFHAYPIYFHISTNLQNVCAVKKSPSLKTEENALEFLIIQRIVQIYIKIVLIFSNNRTAFSLPTNQK